MKYLLLFSLCLSSWVQASLNIVVSVLPQKNWLQALGGEAVQVISLVPQGYAPEHYQPSPQQLAALKQAQLYIRIGMPFEQKWLRRLKQLNPDLILFDMREGLALSGKDPHLWTDPLLVKAHLKRLLPVLENWLPKETLQHRYQQLAQRLTALDQEIQQILSSLKQRSFLSYHPAWGYFAHRYGLEQLSIEQEGKMPSAHSLQKIIKRARQAGIKKIFVQPQHNPRLARWVADQIGAKIVLIDPLSEDYFNTLRQLAQHLATGP